MELILNNNWPTCMIFVSNKDQVYPETIISLIITECIISRKWRVLTGYDYVQNTYLFKTQNTQGV